MKFIGISPLPDQDFRTTPLIVFLVVMVLGLVSSVVSAEEGYSQGWLGAPDWVLDRMDTSILPDFYYPRNVTSERDEIPTVSSAVNEGNDLLAAGSFNEAKKSFEEAIGLNFRSFDAWLGRGYALEGLKRFLSALESYDKAIALSGTKDSAWAAYAGKGRISLELHQYEDAEKAFEISIEKLNSSESGTTEELIDLYIGLAEAKENLGDEYGASVALREAEELRQDPNTSVPFMSNLDKPQYLPVFS